MSRNLNVAVTSASFAEVTRFRLLVEVDSFQGGTAFACTGNNFITYFSGTSPTVLATYSPVGNLGGLDPIQEESDAFPRACKLWFSAINSASIAEVLAENVFNKRVRIYRTFLSDSYTVVSTPEMIFKGTINTCEMKLGDPERGNFFELEVESRLAKQPVARYYDKATLSVVYNQSSSTLFDFVHQIPFTRADWGGMSVTAFSGPAASDQSRRQTLESRRF
jgi:hypothetical protein